MILRIHKKKRLALLSLALVAVGAFQAQAGIKLPSSISANPVLKNATTDNAPQTKTTDGTALPQEEVSLPSLIKAYIPGLVVAGYYRGYFYGRSMTTPYGTIGAAKVLSVGDQTYYGDPNLYLYVGGNVSPTLSFGVELNLVNSMTGPSTKTYAFSIYNTMVMRGSYNAKKWGSYSIVAGGLEWKKLSNLTFGGNVRYNRYSVFERRPWDPTGAVKTKYAAYYETGNFNQDARFGTQAFKGIMISGNDMPLGLTGELMIGKSGTYAGQNRIDLVRPSHEIVARLSKRFKSENEVSLNTYNAVVQTDSVKVFNATPVTFNIVTSDYLVKMNGFTFSGEIGIGKYESPTYEGKWDGAVIFDVQLPKKYTYIPLSVRYYNIGKGFVNKNAAFSNTSLPEATIGYRNVNTAIVVPFGGGMNNVGDLANNRQAVNINGEIKIGKLRLVLGNEVTAENDVLSTNNTVNIGHTINGLSMSRFGGSFGNSPQNFGPNNRFSTFYRGVYESITIVGPSFKKYYNSLEAQLKYKNKFLGRDFYIFQMNTFNSCQDKIAPVTLFNDAAIVRSRVHELDVYYHITRDLMIDFYGGYERIISNSLTTKDARDQTGTAIGLGFDLAITSSTAIYYRHRWMEYADAKKETEDFKGTEGTVELKINF